jgi:hypothetical protein
MSETARMWMEVSFNVVYLLLVWGLVTAMWLRRDRVLPGDRRVAGLVLGAFALLALGDTGHVGFRVLGYAVGNLETTVTLMGAGFGLVGVGALATAVTVTFFYVLVLEVWRARYSRSRDAFYYLLLAAAALRLLLMLSPANEWNSAVPPQPWSLIRNLPLIVLGLGVAYLILRDALAARDRTFVWIGGMILVSYACYMPVILLVQQVPLIGMLMIPKTMAYLAIAVIAFRALYLPRREAVPAGAP